MVVKVVKVVKVVVVKVVVVKVVVLKMMMVVVVKVWLAVKVVGASGALPPLSAEQKKLNLKTKNKKN